MVKIDASVWAKALNINMMVIPQKIGSKIRLGAMDKRLLGNLKPTIRV